MFVSYAAVAKVSGVNAIFLLEDPYYPTLSISVQLSCISTKLSLTAELVL